MAHQDKDKREPLKILSIGIIGAIACIFLFMFVSCKSTQRKEKEVVQRATIVRERPWHQGGSREGMRFFAQMVTYSDSLGREPSTRRYPVQILDWDPDYRMHFKVLLGSPDRDIEYVWNKERNPVYGVFNRRSPKIGGTWAIVTIHDDIVTIDERCKGLPSSLYLYPKKS